MGANIGNIIQSAHSFRREICRLSRICLLQGWEFLQKDELEQDNGSGQKVGRGVFGKPELALCYFFVLIIWSIVLYKLF